MDRPAGMPSQALVGCEGAQVERERGLFERAQRASSGPSARKTSQWLVFSEVGKALAFPRTIPVLLRRSDERLARAGEERAAGWLDLNTHAHKPSEDAVGEPLQLDDPQ